MFDFKLDKLQWIREPKIKLMAQDKVVMVTEPNTDLWQRTYYGFQNDNAPVLNMETNETFFLLQLRHTLTVGNVLTNVGLLFIKIAIIG